MACEAFEVSGSRISVTDFTSILLLGPLSILPIHFDILQIHVRPNISAEHKLNLPLTGSGWVLLDCNNLHLLSQSLYQHDPRTAVL